MTRPHPHIDQYMTTLPITADAGITLEEAKERMTEHNVHHLPVTQAGRLIGVLSDRDVQLLESYHHLGMRHVKVVAVMTGAPFVVPPDAPLDEVVSEMIARRLDSAVVVTGTALVGIFTPTDALEALDDALRHRLPV